MRQNLIDSGQNKPMARRTGNEQERELQELRNQMKGSGLKDSTRHAYHIGRAKPAEYERNKAKMPKHRPNDRTWATSKLVSSQLDTLVNQARKNPNVPQSATIDRDGNRIVNSMTAWPKSYQNGFSLDNQAKAKISEHGNQVNNYDTGARGVNLREFRLKPFVRPAPKQGETLLNQIKSIPKRKERVIKSTAKPKKKCIKDRLKKMMKCFTA